MCIFSGFLTVGRVLRNPKPLRIKYLLSLSALCGGAGAYLEISVFLPGSYRLFAGLRHHGGGTLPCRSSPCGLSSRPVAHIRGGVRCVRICLV